MAQEGQSADAARLGLRASSASGGCTSAAKEEPDADTADALDSDLQIALHDADYPIAEMILTTFLDPKLGGANHSLTTGEVLQHLAGKVAAHHTDLFKSMLKQMCELTKPSNPADPGIWT